MEIISVSKRKFDVLEKVGAGTIIDNTLNKIISFQLAKYKSYIKQINLELHRFEQKYNDSSENIYKQFEEGKLEDKSDFFEWTGLYENIILFKERINLLETTLS